MAHAYEVESMAALKVIGIKLSAESHLLSTKSYSISEAWAQMNDFPTMPNHEHSECRFINTLKSMNNIVG